MSHDGQRVVRILVTGRVQGVGFRHWTRKRALALGLAGWVRNRGDGRVEALLAGQEAEVAKMLAAIRHGPALAAVASVEEHAAEIADADRGGFIERPTV